MSRLSGFILNGGVKAAEVVAMGVKTLKTISRPKTGKRPVPNRDQEPYLIKPKHDRVYLWPR